MYTHYIKISLDFSGQRIDNFLRTYLKSVPKSMIYRIIRTGLVRVNQKKIKFQYKLRINDIIKLPFIRIAKINKLIDPYHVKRIKFLKNFVIYEDDYLLILNKPSGFAVHGGSGLKFGIIEGLKILFPQIKFLKLVHRLDRGTSGVLLFAKKRAALIHLNEQLRLHKVKKEYLALVHGKWNSQTNIIDQPLLNKNFLKIFKPFMLDPNLTRYAITYFKIEEYFSNIATLLSITPITGRTHQIRIHAKYAEHPIIGDDLYGNNEINIKFRKIGLCRLFLHASMMNFIHPDTKKEFFIYAPLEQSLYNFLNFLRNIQLNF